MSVQDRVAELKLLSESMEEKAPEEILRWAVQTYHPKLTMATAFGPEGCTILAMLAQIEPGVRVFNLDTGYQFKETLDLRDRICAKYGIDVELVRVDETVTAMEKRFGGPIYRTNPDECCRLRKVEPLRRAVRGYQAWISGIRRDQTAVRAKSGVVEWDSNFNLIKVNPLANWTAQDVWAYIAVNEVPYNPLHDEGYPSIGCWPCTRAVAPGEEERAGRWSRFAKLECGLHTAK